MRPVEATTALRQLPQMLLDKAHGRDGQRRSSYRLGAMSQQMTKNMTTKKIASIVVSLSSR
jgi:hypothetical protein